MRYTGVLGLYEPVKASYRNAVDTYNKYVRYTQHYFDPDYKGVESEEEYDWFSLLYDFHVPTKGDNEDLIRYMKVNQLSWNDINAKKANRKFGNGTVEAYLGALNFVSDNVKRLYR